MHRVSIVGTSGCGKSTLARQLAERLRLTHIELDALHWLPGWVEAPDAQFREQLTQACAQERWVIDGNYSAVRDIIWPRIDTLVWLDYSFPLILFRTVWRTLRRSLRGEPCCNGNHESLRRAVSRDSVILWMIKTYGPRRAEYLALLPDHAPAGCQVVILRTPRETDEWLAGITTGKFSES